MATKTKAEKEAEALAKLEETRAKLTELAVDFTPENTQAELNALLKEATKATKPSEVSFKLKNGDTRTFSEEVHGEDFEAVAEEFATTHKDKILK